MANRGFVLLLGLACSGGLSASEPTAHNQVPLPELLELRDLDLTGWDCLDRPEGTATTPDGLKRNRLKNRPPVDASAISPPQVFDIAAFLKQTATYDAEIGVKRRSELNETQKERLATIEKRIVTLKGVVNLAYAGPPESTNCGDPVFVDWHLELLEKASDHPPAAGDATPIVCEITPRSERNIFRDNVRIQAISRFFRLFHDLSYQPANNLAREVLVTGYLFWDDEHNGKADIGTRIEDAAPNEYHHPWRSTAWEIHPVLKVAVSRESPGR